MWRFEEGVCRVKKPQNEWFEAVQARKNEGLNHSSEKRQGMRDQLSTCLGGRIKRI